MLSVARDNNRERKRLLGLLSLLFVALALPTAAVIWQAYSRLKWEAFHQFRNQAEELTQRIDNELAERIARAEALAEAFAAPPKHKRRKENTMRSTSPIRLMLVGLITAGFR